MISFLATEKHYLEHLIPTYLALPVEYQGSFYVNTKQLCQLAFNSGVPSENICYFDMKRKNPSMLGDFEIILPLQLPSGPETIFVSAMKDADLIHILDPYKEVILCEHGSGQTFNTLHSSYAGGLGRGWLALCIVPGVVPYNKQIVNYPGVPCVMTGCPKLDALADYVKPDKILQMSNLVVGISNHFADGICSEAGSSFLYFWNQVADLVRSNPKTRFIGHYHPRIVGIEQEKWVELRKSCPNLQLTPEFNFVAREADLYIIDQSSTAFEFAALDKPVIFLNSPHFRKDVNHGMRFWEYADMGVQCDITDSLAEKMVEALLGEYNCKYTERRKQVTKLVYSVPLGQAAVFTAKTLVDFVSGKSFKQEEEVIPMSSEQVIRMKALKMFVEYEGTLFPGIVFAPGYEVTLEKDAHGVTVGKIGDRIVYIDPNVRCSQLAFNGQAEYVYDQDEPVVAEVPDEVAIDAMVNEGSPDVE